MTLYRFLTLDGPPEFFEADDCVLENSEMLALEIGEPHILSWRFYRDGKVIYELPVRLVQEQPVAVFSREHR